MWWALGVVLVAVWVVWIGGCLGQWVFGCWFGLVFGWIRWGWQRFRLLVGVQVAVGCDLEAVGFNFKSVGWDLGGGGWLVQFW